MADFLQYKFVRYLGKGGFAEVNEYVRSAGLEGLRGLGARVPTVRRRYWRIAAQEDSTTGARVAIKQIFEGDKKIGVNLGAIKEMQVMLEIQHPNIIRVRLCPGVSPCAGSRSLPAVSPPS